MCSFKFIANNISALRCESVEVKKWVKLDDAKVPELDVEAIEAKESRLDGVRGVYTSLSAEACGASAIKARYAELWRIEHGFREPLNRSVLLRRSRNG